MPKIKVLIIALFLVSFLTAFSQQFINKSSEKVLKKLNSYEKKEKINTIITENESSITFQLRDTGWQNLDQHFYFNQKGKCYKEILTANCDSCFQKYLTNVLNTKMYKWKVVSPSKYISNYTFQLVLEIDPKKAFTYSIQKHNLTRAQFNKFR
jgi:hypothetical protein